MTVKTINAVRDAENEMFRSRNINCRILADILGNIGNHIAAEYDNQNMPGLYYHLRGLQAELTRYCKWMGEWNEVQKEQPIEPETAPEQLFN